VRVGVGVGDGAGATHSVADGVAVQKTVGRMTCSGVAV
jgi:hypothetical protein